MGPEPARRPRRGDPTLAARLDGPQASLEAAWAAHAAGRPAPLAAELLPHRALLDRAIDEVRRELGPRFEARLPRRQDGEARVAVLAREIVSSALGRIDAEALHEALEVAQRREPLSTAELWALPLALRVALLEEAVAGQERASGCVRSLALLERLDWTKVFERHSRLDEALRGDPVGIYAAMDFATRDRYRRHAERLAWATGRSEVDVARAAIELVGPAGHVGSALVGSDRAALERALGHRPPLVLRLRRWLQAHPALVYLGPVAALTLGLELLLARAVPSTPLRLLAVGIGLVPSVGVAVAVVNQAVLALLPPSLLPKLDLSKGLRPQDRTLVAVPALLTDEAEIDELLARLEVHRAGHPDPLLQFALVTDHTDAPREVMPGDAALVARAGAGVEALNARWPDAPFLLLHRKRDLNPAEACWMGWERKRGKLAELDALILGRPREGAWTVVGDAGRLRGVRYVVTLDADTAVPRGGIARLVGTLAHPLNRPRFDPVTGRVVGGYTVLQPRVEVAPVIEGATAFARIFSGARGLDPYAHAASDVYQDLFGEGSYVGKGIYDVPAFERALAGKIPENALLSHDLLEGLHGRAGLVSDVVVLEQWPRTWRAWARRQHRWIRGDWQLLPWLGPGSGLTPLARWKIVDNLRRSLEAPALLAGLLAAWTVLPGSPWAWTGLLAAVPFASAAPGLAIEAAQRARPGREPPPSAPQVGRKVADTALRVGIGLALLPHEAVISLDAIGRTLARLYVTRRHLLEWTTAAATDRLVAERGGVGAVAELLPAPLVAVGAAALVGTVRPGALLAAAPLLVAWLCAPALALVLSRPSVRGVPALAAAEVARLRRLACRTWAYFEALAVPEHHWLPPDHLQVEPGPTVAARTSPTNAGFGLLAAVAAFDLGYAGPGRTWLRLRATVATLERVERLHGHPFNWIDTRTLRPLEPRFVSTVDSGNLAAALVVVRQAASELATAPVLGPARWAGLADALGVLEELLAPLDPGGRAVTLARAMRHRAEAAPPRPPDALRLAASLEEEGCAALDRALLDLVEGRPGLPEDRIDELRGWACAVREHLALLRSEAVWLAPWLEVEAPPGPSPVPVDALLDLLGAPVTLDEVPERRARALGLVGAVEAGLEPGFCRWRAWCGRLREAFERAGVVSAEVGDGLRALASAAERLVAEMDFRFLYDEDRELLRLGYDASSGRFDPGHYDLLASEARLTSLLAVATGQLPPTHWLRLGRPLRRPGRLAALVSWSGSVFEYLLPPLLLREGDDTLLGQSARAVVAEQVARGRRRGVPWGFSESCWRAQDDQGTWQYRAFGVPSLALKPGLEEELVVAPYATALAARVAPREALANLGALEALGAIGRYGPYEAVDFTSARLPAGRPYEVIRTFLAHHQGMVLVAVANLVRGDPFVRRFHADTAVRSAEVLLLESSPRRVPVERAPPEAGPVPPRAVAPGPWERAPGRIPQRMALSEGPLTAVVGTDGWTSWRGRTVALAFEPWIAEDERRRWPEPSPWTFWAHAAERRVAWGELVLVEVVFVAGGAEIRRVKLTNAGPRFRRVTLGGYRELALGEAEVEEVPGGVLIRSAQQPLGLPPLSGADKAARAPCPVGSASVAVPTAEPTGQPAVRAACPVGSASVAAPTAEPTGQPGPPPACPVASASVAAPTAEPTGQPAAPPACPVASASVAAPTAEPTGQALAVLHQLTIRGDATPAGFEAEREAFLGRHGRLRDRAVLRGRAGTVVSPVAALGATVDLPPGSSVEATFATVVGERRDEVLAIGARCRSPAWVDHALELARDRAAQELAAARVDDLPEAQALLSRALHGPAGEEPLVVVRVRSPEDLAVAQRAARARDLWARRGVPFSLVEARALPADAALPAAARVVLDGAPDPVEPPLPPLVGLRAPPPPEPLEPSEPIELPTPWGGFTPDFGGFLVRVDPRGPPTPAPWGQRVVGPHGLGFRVTEWGGGGTFAGERPLTPDAGDPVLDPPSETVYLRDEETAAIWSATPGPAPGPGPYEVRHEPGRTTFAHRGHGLDQELTLTVHPALPVKLLRLRVKDRTHRPRRITATFLAEWLATAGVDADPDRQVLLARDADGVTFAAADRPLHGLTTDRVEVLGVPARRDRPPGLVRIGLSSRVAPGPDPCAALQVRLDLVPGGTAEVHFLLGAAPDRPTALRMVDEVRTAPAADDGWARRAGVLRVQTPSPVIDALANGLLLAQVLACPPGAPADDRLQDAAALVWADPAAWRRELLRAGEAADPAWLAWSAATYVAATGDDTVHAPREALPPATPGGDHDTRAAIRALWALLRDGRAEEAVAGLERIAPPGQAHRDAARWALEPYACAAGTRARPPWVGRGEGPWATGVAGWTWRFVVHGVLGLVPDRGALRVEPAIPAGWPGFRAVLRRGDTTWDVEVARGDAPGAELDGGPLPEGRIPLAEDGAAHLVRVVLPR